MSIMRLNICVRLQQCLKALISGVLACFLGVLPAIASETKPLRCHLEATPDHFLYYPQQLVFLSQEFALFQNFSGRVATHIDLVTKRMIRTTHIGEPFAPQPQVLIGICKQPRRIINSWGRGEHNKKG